MKFYTYIIYVAFLTMGLHTAAGENRYMRWHDEATDTTAITSLLLKAANQNYPSVGDAVCAFGMEFLDKPYKGGTLEGNPEMLTINLDEFDCTTFMETVAALALTSQSDHYSWKDFAETLQGLRYRNETPDGYASRLHYFSDWVITNSHRGVLRETTSSIPTHDSQIKTLDFMSRNRNLYPALADSAEFQKLKDAEMGYRSHRTDYVKSARIYAKPVANALKSGDIIAFTTKTQGLDVSHVGIIVVEKDGPHLLHASSKAGKVVLEPQPIAEYLKKNHHITGFRIIRLTN